MIIIGMPLSTEHSRIRLCGEPGSTQINTSRRRWYRSTQHLHHVSSSSSLPLPHGRLPQAVPPLPPLAHGLCPEGTMHPGNRFRLHECSPPIDQTCHKQLETHLLSVLEGRCMAKKVEALSLLNGSARKHLKVKDDHYPSMQQELLFQG